jgi:phosphoketolase
MTQPNEAWRTGYGVIQHGDETSERLTEMASHFSETGDGVPFWELLRAADRLASSAMWLTVHDTYARRVYRDGRQLLCEDFKPQPDGHTGSALNIVPAYVGYLLANALTGHTRAWIAEQGHAVSGIDCVNLLVGNVTAAHSIYDLTDAGLSQFVSDFYRYELGPGGRPLSPRGSHVNPNTAGGIMEGGYLGFAGLQYVHLPLPGERLVAFLSDGAFEEQRGPDWAPRWWRREDCGLAAPFLINNGRRIDQRTTSSQQGGTKWLIEHLRLNGFDPIEIDGRDPAAYAWAIWEMERRLEASSGAPPALLPYCVATTVKGYGFFGAGTNASHNLPLGGRMDDEAIALFNEHARHLWVAPAELDRALPLFRRHRDRPRERDHALATRDVQLVHSPRVEYLAIGDAASAMHAVDRVFTATCQANPQLRPRVGNPDEMRSNRLDGTLDFLKHRVTDPEPGVAEAIDGKVITALNEEAVVCAALANKGGINLVHTYEAFGAKMHGALRQEIIFARHCEAAGRPQRWLSVPVVLTSHTYENGKNEQSHQDPALAESLMGEPGDTSRVLFPVDFNSAAAVMEEVYKTHGQIWTVVVAKRDLPVELAAKSAQELVHRGAVILDGANDAEVLLVAIGAYQLREVRRAARRLHKRGISSQVVVLLEPRRFAEPRDDREAASAADAHTLERCFPSRIAARVFVGHIRAELMRGVLAALDTGRSTSVLGYRNAGGTLDVDGMLFVNRQSWAHIVEAACRVLARPANDALEANELAALEGTAAPAVLFAPERSTL